MADTKVIDIAALTVFKTLQDLANAAIFVCKDGDKVLSTNDFTDAEKNSFAELSATFGGFAFATDEEINLMLAEIFTTFSDDSADGYQIATDEQVNAMLDEVFGN